MALCLWFGVCNQPRHSFTTRLLLTCIRSKLFFKEKTVGDIFAEIADQALDMIHNGVKDTFMKLLVRFGLFFLDPANDLKRPPLPSEVSAQRTVRLVPVGVKGDWAFAKKVPRMDSLNCFLFAYLTQFVLNLGGIKP